MPSVYYNAPPPMGHQSTHGQFGSYYGINPAEPIHVPDLDDLKEQEKLRKDSSQTGENGKDKKKYDLLEERLRAIEGVDRFGTMNATELCLVLDVLIPAKFKVPKFEKYDGTKCLMAHITMYCRKMAAQSHDDKLLIHFFQDSLIGSATMKKKQNENFKEYAQRWRDTAAQVQPPLTDKEMTVLFINTLRAPFYERLIGNTTKNFTDLVLSGEIIEEAIKSGKIEGHEVANSKKGNTPKKKEGDVQAIAHDSQQAHNFSPYYPYPPYQPFYPNIGNITQNPYVYQPTPQPTFQTNVLPQTPPPRSLALTNNPDNGQRGPKTTLEKSKFDPIPVPYTTLLPQLIENRLIARTPLEPLRPPFRNGLLNFTKKDSSSVDGNPLPNHGRSTVNAIHEGMMRRVKKSIDEIQTPMDKVFEALSKINAITPEPIDTKKLGHDLAYSCKFHTGAIGYSIQNCDSFCCKLQELMDSSVIEFYEEVEENLVGTINGDTPAEVASSSFGVNKPKPLTIFYEENKSLMNDTSPTMIRSGITIEVLSPFPYKSDKAVPWNYECNILGTASSAPQASFEDLTGMGGITRSGQCYSPEIAERVGKGKPAQGERGLKKAYTFFKDQVVESVVAPNN
ncbi:PREDICTED: uncharacterized protein LOC108661439 [Theobroma cacao]|uniref:Uncharacterized protein LOC108661439 n=1 Tax=Theobroma cacao TaxID=3641 RepID=A0AB32W7D1_THECC|nr:PREDICTED: uncharacterized protein LOC108661439 [Theobroma cacao]